MKANKFNQTKNRIGITLQDYSLLKKYTCGNACVLRAYELLNEGVSIHRQLIRDDLLNLLQKEKVGVILGDKLPFKGVLFSELKPTKTGTNQKEFKNIMQNIHKIIGRPVILNFYSDIGEQALKTTSFIYEFLKEAGYKPTVTNGIEINQKSVDFNDNNIDDFLKKDYLIINSLNSVFVTEYRKAFLDNLYTSARLKCIPIITASNEELKVKDRKVINIKLTDEKKNQQELIMDIFGEA